MERIKMMIFLSDIAVNIQGKTNSIPVFRLIMVINLTNIKRELGINSSSTVNITLPTLFRNKNVEK